MSLNKRVEGDFTIESVGAGDQIILKSTGGIRIEGDLTVTGASSTVESTDTIIVDNTIVLNSGEAGAGVTDTGLVAGIEIDRGSLTNVGLRYNDGTDKWEATDDGSIYYDLDALSAFVYELSDDLSPQLGGNLDVNGFSITSAANGDIVIVADGTGLVQLNQDLSLKEQVGDETPTATYNKLYAKALGTGGSGLFFSNLNETDELVSKKKAMAFSLIF